MKMDFRFHNKELPQAGDVLLSAPFEMDEHFTRSVVLVCSHDDSGTFGFVLNNYVHLSPEDLNVGLALFKTRVSIGGPMDKSNLFYIHQFGNLVEGSQLIKGDLYFGGDFDQIVDHIERHPDEQDKVRFFIGYSGWGEGQLVDELDTNSWLVVKNHTPAHIMNTHVNELWRELMTLQGARYSMLASFPINPTDN